MKRLKLRAMALSLLLAIGMNVLAGETVVDNPRFPRKALVAPDCMINTMINVVSVGSGTEGMNCLLDENLDNYATLAGLADVGLLSDPIVRVKNLNPHHRPVQCGWQQIARHPTVGWSRQNPLGLLPANAGHGFPDHTEKRKRRMGRMVSFGYPASEELPAGNCRDGDSAGCAQHECRPLLPRKGQSYG